MSITSGVKSALGEFTKLSLINLKVPATTAKSLVSRMEAIKWQSDSVVGLPIQQTPVNNNVVALPAVAVEA